jgi:DNA repair protein RecO (recombination protein O)
MRIDQQPAYVLHARPYRETSLLLECLTRDQGRLGVVARGVRGGRGRLQRAHLEAFQALSLDLQLRGELATLRGAEATAAPVRLLGDALLGGLYANELLVRLSERQDPHAALFDAYAATVTRLAGGDAVGWTMRRFERELLAAIGYALVLDREADSGEALDPDGCYRYVPEHGPVVATTQDQAGLVHGRDLLALAADRAPDADGQRALRRMLRAVIRFHLGGAELRAWRVLRGPR